MTTTTKLITRLEATRNETLKYFELSDADLDLTYGAGKWSVRFLLHHLSDSETVFYDRICRVLSEPRQVLWVYDEKAWAKGLDYARKPLQLAQPVYQSLRESIIYATRLHYESKGHLEFVHSVTGVRMLKDEMEKVASHNEHHLAHIRGALNLAHLTPFMNLVRRGRGRPPSP
jgi:hypothetical protein